VLASEPALADPRASLRDWAADLAADAARQPHALDLEQLASIAVSAWGRENVYDVPPSETPPEIELVAHLERIGGTGGLLMLRGLAHVAGGAVASAAAAAAERLLSSGRPVFVPSWADAIGAASPTGAWIVRDTDYDDGVTLFAEFEQEGCPTHTVCMFVDHNLGDTAKVVGLTGSMRDTVPDGCELGDPEPVPPAEMGVRMRSALRATHPLRRKRSHSDDGERFALVWARADALGGDDGTAPQVPDVTPEDRFELLTEFLDSDGGKRFRDDVDAQTVVALAVDFCAERDGKPLRWSPVAVERFMCWWLPAQAAEQREVLESAPVALKAWVKYAGRRVGVPAAKVRATARAVDEWSAEMFAEAEAWVGEAASG
jgi:hypothetical protein